MASSRGADGGGFHDAGWVKLRRIDEGREEGRQLLIEKRSNCAQMGRSKDRFGSGLRATLLQPFVLNEEFTSADISPGTTSFDYFNPENRANQEWWEMVATIGELDSRTRYLMNEIEGEKAVTRHVLHQATLNADDLGTLKTEVRHLNEKMVLANAALHSQSGRLTSLAQDVTMIRQDVTALRRGMEEVHTRLDGMDRRFEAMDRRFDSMDCRFDAADHRFDAIERNITAMERNIAAMERNIAAMQGNIAVILATVAPQIPPPAEA